MTAPDQRCGLLRRLGAIFYDSLLLFSILFFATLILLPLTGGEAVRPGQPIYTAYLIAVSFVYFAWFWTHGGQTLGMRAWRVTLRTRDGSAVTWRHALVRSVAAVLSWIPCGAGFLWGLFDRERLTWHDRLSGTEVVKK